MSFILALKALGLGLLVFRSIGYVQATAGPVYARSRLHNHIWAYTYASYRYRYRKNITLRFFTLTAKQVLLFEIFINIMKITVYTSPSTDTNSQLPPLCCEICHLSFLDTSLFKKSQKIMFTEKKIMVKICT